jgi:serine/threonine protein kinase
MCCMPQEMSEAESVLFVCFAPQVVRDHYPTRLRDWLVKCLERDPQKRPTAAEALRTIQKWS